MEERPLSPMEPEGSGFWGTALKIVLAGGVVYLIFTLAAPYIYQKVEKKDGFFDPSATTIKIDVSRSQQPRMMDNAAEKRTTVRVYPAGFEPYGPPTEYGLSRAIFVNDTDKDAVVKMVRLTKETGEFDKVARNSFVPRNEAVTLEWVPPGKYIIRISLGEDWDNQNKRFTKQWGYLATNPLDFIESSQKVLESGVSMEKKAGTEVELLLDNSVFSGIQYKLIDAVTFNYVE